MGYQEILLIMAVVLVVFGPKRLPELARGLAQVMHTVRSATSELRRSVLFDLDDVGREPPAHRPYHDLYRGDGSATDETGTYGMANSEDDNVYPPGYPDDATPVEDAVYEEPVADEPAAGPEDADPAPDDEQPPATST